MDASVAAVPVGPGEEGNNFSTATSRVASFQTVFDGTLTNRACAHSEPSSSSTSNNCSNLSASIPMSVSVGDLAESKYTNSPLRWSRSTT